MEIDFRNLPVRDVRGQLVREMEKPSLPCDISVDLPDKIYRTTEDVRAAALAMAIVRQPVIDLSEEDVKLLRAELERLKYFAFIKRAFEEAVEEARKITEVEPINN